MQGKKSSLSSFSQFVRVKLCQKTAKDKRHIKTGTDTTLEFFLQRFQKTSRGEDYFTDWNVSPAGTKVYRAFEVSNVENLKLTLQLKKAGEEKGNFCSGKVLFSDANRNPSFKGRSRDELSQFSLLERDKKIMNLLNTFFF